MDLTFLDREVSIKIGDAEYPNTISQDIRIDRTNLNAEFLRQPEVFTYYASMEAMAKARAAHLKWQRDIVYAQLDAKVRIESKADTSIKWTEKMFESKVKTAPEYQEVCLELIEMEKLANILGGFRAALEHKRTSLVSLGADNRVGAFDPRTLATQAEDVKAKLGANPQHSGPAQAPSETTKPTRRRRPKSP